jgi:hypothetical protein
MAKNLTLVNTNPDILKYDNRKAIELAQTLRRPLTSSEYETLKIKVFPQKTAPKPSKSPKNTLTSQKRTSTPD